MGNLKYKQKHKKAGLCIDCSRPAKAGRVRCDRHALYQCKKDKASNYARVKNYREKWRKEGRCTTCAAPLDIDADCNMVTCINCRSITCK